MAHEAFYSHARLRCSYGSNALPGGAVYVVMPSKHPINIKGNLVCSVLKPPECFHPATWKIQSNVMVETILSRYLLDVESLLQYQLFMPSGLGEYCCSLSFYGVMSLPGMFCNRWLLQHPSLTGILVFLHSGFQSPDCLSNVDLVTAPWNLVHNSGLLSQWQDVLHINWSASSKGVWPDLKTTLISNPLYTCLMSSLTPAIQGSTTNGVLSTSSTLVFSSSLEGEDQEARRSPVTRISVANCDPKAWTNG